MKHMVLTLLCVASFASTYCGDKKDLNEKKDSASSKAALTTEQQITELQAQVAALRENLKSTQDQLKTTKEERDDAISWKRRYKNQLDNPRTTPSYGP